MTTKIGWVRDAAEKQGETAMKEHPIIMSADSVRAILAGQKTQTRRVIRPQPRPRNDSAYTDDPEGWWFLPGKGSRGDLNVAEWDLRLSPYGELGDRLWVRETWWQPPVCDASIGIQYDADLNAADRKNARRDLLPIGWRICSPIYMPRWASRITLEITDVRPERLQMITHEDIVDEGIAPPLHTYDETCEWLRRFRTHWDTLNAKRGFGFDTNPWVWRICFERVQEIPA